MLLAIDVGNTETAIGLFNGEEQIRTWHLTTTIYRTSDEWSFLVKNHLKEAGCSFNDISGVSIASVVPMITTFLEQIFDKSKVMLVNQNNCAGIKLEIDNPRELGADRIANAAAAHYIYKKNCIITDFGTATTIDAVSTDGAYLGGAIAPGIAISAEALFKSGAQLNQTVISPPKSVVGKNTSDCLKSGIFYGTIYQTEGLANAILDELGWQKDRKNTIHIVTGGLSNLIYPYSKIYDLQDVDLTLKGLKVIYDHAVSREKK